MRKLFTFDMVSVDGYFARKNDELDWHNVDAEFNDFATKQLDEIGTLLFGRVTYEVMASWWGTEQSRRDDPIVSAKMNELPKLVAAKSLSLPWGNSKLVEGNVIEAISALKKTDGKPIAIFGSSILSVSLLEAGLVDEVRVIVAPILLGEGRPLFAGLKSDIKLEIEQSQAFKSGNVLTSYRVAQPA